MPSPNLTPDRLLEISGYYWNTCTLHAAVKLDLFSILGDRQLTAEAVADRINASKDAVERLMNALSAMNILSKTDHSFQNTPASQKYLVQESPEYIGWMILHHHHLVKSWSQLDQAVISGQPVRDDTSAGADEWREAFLKGMQTNARFQAHSVVQSLDLTRGGKLLDLGGGPATYAIEFCKANANLEAVVFDVPESRFIAEQNIRTEQLSQRIHFQAGDYHRDAIKGSFDIAWLSHILHGEGPEDCNKIISKAAAALKPGGAIFIQDFILNDTMDGPLFPALFSLNMLVGTPTGRAYSEKELTNMLLAAGLQRIRRLPFRGPTDAGIIEGHMDLTA